MTIYKKPDLKVFGANAKPTEIAEFEDLLRGWGITIEKTNGIPPMEWFNYLFNRLDGNINYILQNGITEYDTNLEYPQNAVVKSGGKLYLCLRQNTSKPLSNGAYWELLIKNATTSQSGIVELSSSVTSTDETKASTPKATKTAYDKAVQANTNADGRVSKNGDTMTGALMINNKTPLVYGKTKGESVWYLGADSEKGDVGIYNFITGTRLTVANHKCKVDNYNILDARDTSNSVTSERQDEVATSLAVKKAYDVAIQANNNANTRVSSSGGIMTGDLIINSSQWSNLELRNKQTGFKCLFETSPTAREDSPNMGNFIYRKPDNSNVSIVEIPNKNGKLILNSDFTGSISKNGWSRLPNGLIMQWLTFTSPCSSKRSWPIAFTQIFNVTASQVMIDGGSYMQNFDQDVFYTTTQVWGRYQKEVRVFAVGI